jgi:hypothetical protein
MSAADELRRALARQGEVSSSAAGAMKAAMAPPKAEPKKPLAWYEVATKLKEINDALEQQQKADAEAAAEPRPAEPQTASAMLARALSGGSSGTMPLNGAQVLRAAIAGMGAKGATVNGGQSS